MPRPFAEPGLRRVRSGSSTETELNRTLLFDPVGVKDMILRLGPE